MVDHLALTCDEFMDLAVAVALDAAEPNEIERVGEHAAQCPECAAQLEELREVSALLGLAVPQQDPPLALRGRVLAAASRTMQQRPAGRRRPDWRWPPRRRGAAGWLVAAASLCASLGAIVWVALLQGQIAALRSDAQLARDRAARYDHVVEVLASDKLAIRPLQPVVQNMPSRGMLYMDPSSGTGMLTCHNLPAIEQGHAYQVWFVRGNERVSGGLLWPDRSGNGYTLIQVPSDLQSYDSVGITDEPGTGSQWPTTPRIIGTPLRGSEQ